MVLKAGGPCGNCGCTEASAWYGKPPGPRSCKKGACRRALGFAAPLQGGKRGRSGSTCSADDEDEDSAGDLYLHELEAIYGARLFGVKEKDKGYWDTRWCALADLLDQQQVTHEEISDAIEEWEEGVEAARECLFAAAAPA